MRTDSPASRVPCTSPQLERTVPASVKWAFTAFMAVLVPTYWHHYGPTNFIYFCDLALFVTLFAVWRNSPVAASSAAVGIVIPQIFWCIDFGCELAGFKLTGMTSYMFDQDRDLFLRGLSLFHGWLPFLLIYLVARLGYDSRGLKSWTVLAWSACLIAFLFLPAAGEAVADINVPRNVNYVFGIDDAKPQEWMPAGAYLLCWMVGLFAVFFVPTHLVLKRFFGREVSY